MAEYASISPTMRNKDFFIQAAVLGLLSSQVMASDPSQSPSTKTSSSATVKCYGINSCKGSGACKSQNNTCRGANACKGQGWLPTSRSECKGKIIDN